ncbi:Fic family protein [Desulforapulum autotrophicum]
MPHGSFKTPALKAGLVEKTIQDKPKSGKQRYRDTKKRM